MLEKKEKQGWSRREFLTGVGVSIGLPFFPSLFPRTAWADGVTPPTRLMFMSVPLGFIPNQFVCKAEIFKEFEGWFPEQDGADYKMPAAHADLEPYRKHFSFVKGLTNRRYRGEHHSNHDALLTCADTFADPARGFSNTVSCDQVAAGSPIMGGKDVRHPSITLGIAPTMGATYGGLSWTEQGVPLSPMQSPAQVFDHLFGADDVPPDIRIQRLKEKRSVLDMTLHQVRNLNNKLNAADRRKLAEVVNAVRGVEANIQREQMWINVPKPKISLERPDESIGVASVRHAQTMFDLAHAAFLTDSSRVITYEMPDVLKEVTSYGKHAMTHPTGPELVKDFARLDLEMSKQVAHFIKLMCETKGHDDQPLIHHTLAAYGSGLWGPAHSGKNLPFMLIGHGGGRIRQGITHQYPDPTPLANLWLTMLQAAGVTVKAKGAQAKEEEVKIIDNFADSTGTLDGLIK